MGAATVTVVGRISSAAVYVGTFISELDDRIVDRCIIEKLDELNSVVSKGSFWHANYVNAKVDLVAYNAGIDVSVEASQLNIPDQETVRDKLADARQRRDTNWQNIQTLNDRISNLVAEAKQCERYRGELG